MERDGEMLLTLGHGTGSQGDRRPTKVRFRNLTSLSQASVADAQYPPCLWVTARGTGVLSECQGKALEGVALAQAGHPWRTRKGEAERASHPLHSGM